MKDFLFIAGSISATLGTTAYYQAFPEDNSPAQSIAPIGPEEPELMSTPLARIITRQCEDDRARIACMGKPYADRMKCLQSDETISVAQQFCGPRMEVLVPAIIESADEYDLDPIMIAAVISKESAWSEKAHSPAGAAGVMQLMPQWHSDVPFIGSLPHRARCLKKPAGCQGQVVKKGAHALRKYLDQYDNDLPRALQRYNAGACDKNSKLNRCKAGKKYAEKVINIMKLMGRTND